MSIPPGYLPLKKALNDALEQAASGKGKERHADDKPFTSQPIMRITKNVGTGFPLGQAEKKIIEAAGMLGRGQSQQARQELLGAIVYLCAAYIFIGDEQK